MRLSRILLVDDEIGLREAIAESLRMRGYLVTESATYADALEKAREETFDALVTDIRLGSQDGLSLARRIRSFHPAIALIFITGYGSLDLAISAVRLGAVDFIRKPFRISLLLEALDRAAGSVSAPAPSQAVDRDDRIATEAPISDGFEVSESARKDLELREMLWKRSAAGEADPATGDRES